MTKNSGIIKDLTPNTRSHISEVARQELEQGNVKGAYVERGGIFFRCRNAKEALQIIEQQEAKKEIDSKSSNGNANGR